MRSTSRGALGRRQARQEGAVALTVRTVVAVTLTVAAGVLDLDPSTVRAVGFGLALVWLPAAAMADLVLIERPGPLARLVRAVLDAAGPAAVVFGAPELAEVGLVTLTVVSAGHLLVGENGPGREMVAATALVTAIAVGRGSADGAIVVASLGVLTSLVVIAAVAAETRSRATRGLSQVHHRSDAILAGVGEAVVVTSPRGRIRQWNPAATLTFSCSPDEAVGSRCQDVLGLHRDVAPLDCAAGCALMGAGDQEVWRHLGDGRRQPLLVVASPVHDTNGDIREVVHSLRDVTTLKQADEAKTLFLATASHELKTPLAVIHGFSGILLEADDLPERHRSSLEAIHRRTRDLSGIVERLLMSSRIEAGHVQLRPVPVDVIPLVTERVEATRMARQRKIELTVAPGVPMADADSDAVHTVIDHLLDNAIKYSAHHEPIEVAVSHEGDRVTISVADQGIGMTGAQAEHCFDRFWQAEATDVRQYGGTGIGLYIVRSLVEALRGTVSVASTPGRGTRFAVELWAEGAVPEPVDEEAPALIGAREPSIIREFMRQVGVGAGRGQ